MRQVSAEMKEHIESTELEMVARLEEERFATEELYHKKLTLVKGATEKRADSASVQAHTELLQRTRDWHRREAEYQRQEKEQQAALERAEKQMEQLKEAAALREAELQKELAASLNSLAVSRERADSLEASLEQQQRQQLRLNDEVESTRAALLAESEAAAEARARAEALHERLANVIELQRVNVKAPAEKPSTRSRPAKVVVDDCPISVEVTASPKRALEEANFRVGVVPPVAAAIKEQKRLRSRPT